MTEPTTTPAEEIAAWFRDRLPQGWYAEPEVLVDRDEIVVRGDLAHPGDGLADDAIDDFREATRSERVEIARRAEALFGRKVSWGASSGEVRVLFSHLSVPVMTRLRIDERQVLDTLVAAGVARSRSDALAWCSRYVGRHQNDWMCELREAIEEVERIRAKGPD